MKNKRLNFVKSLIIIFFTFLVFCLAGVFFADYRIEKSSDNLVYDDVNLIPHNKVGLLLGTAKYISDNYGNPYYEYRITAATDLYNAGKIDYILISGDNGNENYNEPQDMKNDLIKNGIPEDRIVLDYAGFRTYDSVIRINKIFGQTSFTIISQEFHNRRAIYIAKCFNLNAIGYNAKDVNSASAFKTNLREKFARVKVFVDLLINKEPKFLGEKIEIGN